MWPAGLEAAGAILAVAGLHDGDGVGGGENLLVAGAGVVGVAVGDDGTLAGERGIDIGIDAPDMEIAIEYLGHDPGLCAKLAWRGGKLGDRAIVYTAWSLNVGRPGSVQALAWHIGKGSGHESYRV